MKKSNRGQWNDFIGQRVQMMLVSSTCCCYLYTLASVLVDVQLSRNIFHFLHRRWDHLTGWAQIPLIWNHGLSAGKMNSASKKPSWSWGCSMAGSWCLVQCTCACLLLPSSKGGKVFYPPKCPICYKPQMLLPCSQTDRSCSYWFRFKFWAVWITTPALAGESWFSVTCELGCSVTTTTMSHTQ